VQADYAVIGVFFIEALHRGYLGIALLLVALALFLFFDGEENGDESAAERVG
jgi:hypothetical protein